MGNAAVCARKLQWGTWELDLNADKEFLEELEKHCGSKSIVAQPDSNLLPSDQWRTIIPLRHRLTMEKIVNRFVHYYHHYMQAWPTFAEV